MAVHHNREAFIPYSRQEIIELCIADGIAPAEQQDFREFCQILIAYYHFKLHYYLENLKSDFLPFDPDLNNDRAINSSPAVDCISELEFKQQEDNLISNFESILKQANYRSISQQELEQALLNDSLFDLKTEVDFSDFERMVCYARGDSSETVKLKKWFWQTIDRQIEIYQQVALLIKFKEEQHFQDKPVPKEQLNFKPGKIYLYLYKNLSKLDIEFIFPNIQMSMNWKDRLLLGVPAIGAAIPLLLRLLPQIILVVGVIIYLTLGYQPINELEVKEEDVRNIMPLLIAVLSLTVTLGGFAFKQFTKYKNKQIKFQKNVTDTLFYRNLANNSGVFKYLIDAAEEEECKEIILVYYHLLISSTPLTPEALDDRIELWMEEKLGIQIDFDIEKTLDNLAAIKAPLKTSQGSAYTIKQTALLQRDCNYGCRVLSLTEAKQVIDCIWDRVFDYGSN